MLFLSWHSNVSIQPPYIGRTFEIVLNNVLDFEAQHRFKSHADRLLFRLDAWTVACRVRPQIKTSEKATRRKKKEMTRMGKIEKKK